VSALPKERTFSWQQIYEKLPYVEAVSVFGGRQKISEHRFDKDFKDCYLCQAKVLWIGIEAKDQKGIR